MHQATHRALRVGGIWIRERRLFNTTRRSTAPLSWVMTKLIFVHCHLLWLNPLMMHTLRLRLNQKK